MRFKGQAPKDKRMAAGSGWLIADNLLVTAAHCVYDHVNNLGPATQIRAYVGYHGKESVTKDNKVQLRHGKVVVAPSSWVNGKARINDFALIKLSEAFTEVKPISFQPTPLKGTEKLSVVGYPVDKQEGGDLGALMYCCSETVTFDRAKTGGLLSYKISTYPGMYQSLHVC
jgi:V8-like Glu-specific endopeptidase